MMWLEDWLITFPNQMTSNLQTNILLFSKLISRDKPVMIVDIELKVLSCVLTLGLQINEKIVPPHFLV